MPSSISQKLHTSILTLLLSLSAAAKNSHPAGRKANPTNLISVIHLFILIFGAMYLHNLVIDPGIYDIGSFFSFSKAT